MLLDLPRQRIKVACAPMTADLPPAGLCRPSRLDRGVYVLLAGIRDFGKRLARGGIRRLEPCAGKGLPPFSADEETESTIVAIEPGVRSPGALWRRTILHRLVYLCDRRHAPTFPSRTLRSASRLPVPTQRHTWPSRPHPRFRRPRRSKK